MPEQIYRIFNRARIDDRQMNELLGLAKGIIADGMVNQSEVEYLHKWLVANQDASQNPIISNLLTRVQDMLSDGVLDDDESRELLEVLRKFTGGDFELGELLKSTTLPLTEPPPDIQFDDRNFCFTGTFAFGSRKECEAAVIEKGGQAGRLTTKTDYLVIGIYATDSWAHSSYGRKIERAVKMREDGRRISIVSEIHWVEFLKE